MKKTAIMFVTHCDDDFNQQQFLKLLELEKQHPDNYDVWVLYNSDSIPFGFSKLTDKIWLFNRNVIENVCGLKMHIYGNPNRPFYGHNIELSFLSFYQNHNEYDYYWNIEYDVFFNGDWNVFFNRYNSNTTDVDLLTTYYGELSEDSTWGGKDSIWFKTVTVKQKYICFNPIDRLSNKALSIMLDAYKKGDYGFYETAMPTLFKIHNLKVENISEEFWHKSHYTYLRVNVPYVIDNKLYHAVKHF